MHCVENRSKGGTIRKRDEYVSRIKDKDKVDTLKGNEFQKKSPLKHQEALHILNGITSCDDHNGF